MAATIYTFLKTTEEYEFDTCFVSFTHFKMADEVSWVWVDAVTKSILSIINVHVQVTHISKVHELKRTKQKNVDNIH